MPYATLSDLEERYSPAEILSVADRDGDGVADSTVISAALADASELIDGYLAGRYELPLVAAPGLVKGWCCDIARRRMHKDDPPSYIVDAHDEALRQLRDVQAGRMILQVAGIQAPAASVSDTQVLLDEDGGRVFDQSALKGY